ncbi:MAG: hypothetical protein KGI37_07735 [Alphaproteobacteria bacterium]|nr:hypothetical protein [Alphaproteobacteria bacterium]
MALYRAYLRDLIVGILKSANTAAGMRVFSPLDTPTWDGEYPIIVVRFGRSPTERKESTGPVPVSFKTTAFIAITAQIAAVTAEAAELALDQISAQIEGSVIGNFELMKGITQIASVDTSMDINSEGKEHLGQITQILALEYFETGDDFAPINAIDLCGVNVTVDLQSPTDPIGIYKNPAFPQSVAPAPRTTGMDGRAEAILDIDFSQKD